MTHNTLSTPAGELIPARLRELLQSPDAAQIEQAIGEMLRERERSLFVSLGQLARDLHESVKNVACALNSGASDAPGMPEARRRLDEALDMSEKAAHKSLDVGDRLLEGAERLEKSATAQAEASSPLAAVALAFARTCRDDVRALREAQSWQDLTGQRMKQVSQFLARIEDSVLDLVHLAGSLGGPQAQTTTTETTVAASSQDEVDRLLAEFGF